MILKTTKYHRLYTILNYIAVEDESNVLLNQVSSVSLKSLLRAVQIKHHFEQHSTLVISF